MLHSINSFAQTTINLLGLRGRSSANTHQQEFKPVKLTDMPNDVLVKIASFAAAGKYRHPSISENLLNLKKVSLQLKEVIYDNEDLILNSAKAIKEQNIDLSMSMKKNRQSIVEKWINLVSNGA